MAEKKNMELAKALEPNYTVMHNLFFLLSLLAVLRLAEAT